MNSYLNITVRVLTKQAQVMLANLETQLKTTSRVATSSGYGATQAATAAKGFKALGNSMQWAGYQLLHAFTIPLVAAGAAATKYELDNERAMAGLRKVYGDTALQMSIGTKGINAELKALQKEFVALSDTYGQSQSDIIGIAEAWAAAGVSGKALGTAVNETAKTMVIGDLDAADATKALIAIQAQYGASTHGLVKIVQDLNTTENITGATMGDLIKGFSLSAGVAAGAGVSYKELAAMIAALVPASGTASRAGNALKTIITDIMAPTQKASDYLKALGINTQSAAFQSKSATQRLVEMSLAYNKLNANQRTQVANAVVGKYQISRFNILMSDFNKSLDNNGKVLKTNGDAIGYYGRTINGTASDVNNARIAQKELNTVLASNPQKLKQVWTILKNDAAKAVVQLIPYIIQLAYYVAGMVHWFSTLNPVIQKWIVILGIGLALLGPVLLYMAAISKTVHVLGTVFGAVLKPFKAFFGLFNSQNRQIATLEARVKALKAELADLTATSPIAKLEEEIAGLEAQIADVYAGMAKAETTLFEDMQATTDAIIANTDAQLKAAQKADYEKVASAQAANAEIVASAEAAARSIPALYSVSGTELVGAMEVTGKAIQGEFVNIATAADAAAAEMTTVFVAGAEGIDVALVQVGTTMAMILKMWDLLAANATGASLTVVGAIGGETDAMLAELAMMANVMNFRNLTTKTWIETGILQAASVDQVTARLLIQLQALRAVQAEAMLTSKRMIEAQSAAAGSAVVATRSTAAAAVAPVATRGASTAESAAAGTLAAQLAARRPATTRAAESMAKDTEGVFSRMGTKLSAIFSAVFGGLGRIISSGGSKALNAARVLAGGLWKVLIKIPLIGPMFESLGGVIAGALEAAGAALGVSAGVIGAIIVAIIAFFLLFRHEIEKDIKTTVSMIVWLGKQVWSGMKFFGRAVMAGLRIAVAGLEAFPRIVVAVFNSVVSVIEQAAKEIYELFSYLNPFAHHSPSLVENVENGINRVIKQFSSLRNVKGYFTQTYADINKFGKAIAGLIKTDKQAQEAADIKLLSKFAPGAIGEYKRLQAELGTLTQAYNQLGRAVAKQQTIVDAYQAVVDKLSAKLTKQQDILTKLQVKQSKYSDLLSNAKQAVQDYANTQIQGQQAMSDAIFNNTMQQEQLQLQMDKMQDAVPGIQNVTDALAKMAGQTEVMQGTITDLKLGGAGSDITGPLEAQMKALDTQSSQLQDQANQYGKLQTALDALQHQADELNLEQSLQFDPLTRQIDQLANAAKELPFDQIIAGIEKSQQDVDKYTKAYNDATTAVNAQQKAVDKAQAAHDKAQATLDSEQKKLDNLNKAYSKLDDVMSKVSDTLSSMSSAANDLASSLKKAKDAGGGIADLGGGAGLKPAGGIHSLGRAGGLKSQVDKINKQTQKLLDNLQDKFNKLDLFGPIKDKIKGFGNWIKKWIWDEPASWGDWINQKTHGIAGLIVENIIGGVPLMILSHRKQIGNAFSQLGDWIVTGLTAAFNAVLGFFSKLPGEMLGALKALPKQLETTGKKIMYGLGYGIGYGIGLVLKYFIGLPIEIAKLLYGANKWLLKIGLDILKGLLTGIEDMWNKGIVPFFKNLPHNILALITNAPGWLLSAGISIVTGFVTGITTAAVAIWAFFKNLPSNIKGFFTGSGGWLLSVGGDILKGLWKGITEQFQIVWTGIKTFISGFINGFKNALGIHSPSTVFISLGKDTILGFLHGVEQIASDVIKWFTQWPDRLVKSLGNLLNLLKQKGLDLLQGLWDGARSRLGDVEDWFKALPGRMRGWITAPLDILKNVGAQIMRGFWQGLTSVAGGALNIGRAVENAINGALGLPRKLGGWHLGVSVLGHDVGVTFPTITIPALAQGGIFDKATTAMVGEAGKEVVIPLTNPTRAWQLVQQSGLLNVISSYMGDYGSIANKAMSKLDSGSGDTVTNRTTTNNVNITFTGDLSFPNVKSGDDAESFLKNLEVLAGK